MRLLRDVTSIYEIHNGLEADIREQLDSKAETSAYAYVRRTVFNVSNSGVVANCGLLYASTVADLNKQLKRKTK